MTQDEIIEMLRASCDKDRVDPEQNGFWVIVTEELEAFAKRVRNDYSNKHAQLWLKRIDEAVKAEREACANVCEDQTQEYYSDGSDRAMNYQCAEAIRARGTEA